MNQKDIPSYYAFVYSHRSNTWKGVYKRKLKETAVLTHKKNKVQETKINKNLKSAEPQSFESWLLRQVKVCA
jgi:hypothetical protein